MSRLGSKVAAVIGGVGGIGGAIPERFLAEGAKVYATSRRGAGDESQVQTVNLQMIRADASDRADLQRVFEQIRAEQGRVDVLVVNAGMSEYAPLEDISEDHFDRTFGLNVKSLVFAAQGAIDMMQTGGTIVLIGSIAGDIGTKGYGV